MNKTKEILEEFDKFFPLSTFATENYHGKADENEFNLWQTQQTNFAKARVERIKDFILKSCKDYADWKIKELINYVEHDRRCILTYLERGEPTEDGGYRQKYAGKWYQSSPVDETPKCDCGLDAILSNKYKK